MKYNLVLTVSTKNPGHFFKIFNSEAGKKDRSEIKIRKENHKVIFDVVSLDHTALKASANVIIKMLTVYEKTLALAEKNGY